MKVEGSSRSLAVSDVALAADRIRLVAGNRGVDDPVKVLWERAFAELVKRNPKWTRRRVRALWNKEAARIDHREMAEMDAVLALREARKGHAEFIAETERLATMFAHADEDFHSHQIEARRLIAGGVGLSRTAGDDQ